ncbi:hypothetical protein [Sinomonas halotolerans]|uniref:PknH-like extracellular domain-containing protein n=1 Tax=Sinomonas halotolerans TaxID=1644133 RepID=A0ABU9WVD9_9MICC
MALWTSRVLSVCALAVAAAALAGCRGPEIPPPSGEYRAGLNAAGQQRTFAADELVATAAETRTALGLGGTVLDHAQLAQVPRSGAPDARAGAGATAGFLGAAEPAACRVLGTPAATLGTLGAGDAGRAVVPGATALITAPSDSRAQRTAVGLASHAAPEAAVDAVSAFAQRAAACARHTAAVDGRRVPVVVRTADPGASADSAAMATVTALVPDPDGGGTPQERTLVHAVAAKGTVTVEVLLVQTRPDDAAAAVRAYADMAFSRLPL